MKVAYRRTASLLMMGILGTSLVACSNPSTPPVDGQGQSASSASPASSDPEADYGFEEGQPTEETLTQMLKATDTLDEALEKSKIGSFKLPDVVRIGDNEFFRSRYEAATDEVRVSYEGSIGYVLVDKVKGETGSQLYQWMTVSEYESKDIECDNGKKIQVFSDSDGNLVGAAWASNGNSYGTILFGDIKGFAMTEGDIKAIYNDLAEDQRS